MNEEISRVLTMVEEGKLDKEKAAELISVLQDKGEQVPAQMQPSSPYLDKVLKVRVTSEDRDNVNLPIKLVKAVLSVGTILEFIVAIASVTASISFKYVK